MRFGIGSSTSCFGVHRWVVHKTNAEPATGGEDSHLSASDGTTVGTLDTDMDRGSEVEDGETQPAGQPAAGPQRLGPPKDERTRRLLQQLTLQIEHLDPAQKSQLTGLITSFSDVFALDASELGTTTLVTHVINTGDQGPIRQPVRRMPFALRSEVDQMVGDMLDQGVIEPSSSPWASPMVLVWKKDGGMRFCVDYRRLNHVTKLDEFPLPRIDDTLDLLAGGRYFTTLYLASGYWQVAMDPASQEKTAFTTYSGLYEFRKMPFGLVNAPRHSNV